MNALTLQDLGALSLARELSGFYLSADIAIETRRLGLPRLDGPRAPSNLAKELHAQTLQGNKVAVHIRRGDFVRHRSRFGLLDETYYRPALKHALEVAAQDSVLVFTDDPSAAYDIMLKTGCQFTVVDPRLELTSAETLWVMAASRAIVASNSTVSWHAGFWSSSGSLVVLPSPLYVDETIEHRLFVPGWTKVPSGFSS